MIKATWGTSQTTWAGTNHWGETGCALPCFSPPFSLFLPAFDYHAA